MVFYICHIYLGHSSVFISLQLLYQQYCSKCTVSAKTWRAVTEREQGLTLATSMCGERLLSAPVDVSLLSDHPLLKH